MDAGPRHPPPGLDTEKKTLGACERDEEQRHAFRVQIATRAATDFVIVAETGSNIHLTPRYAPAPRGARAWQHPAQHALQLDPDRGNEHRGHGSSNGAGWRNRHPGV